VRGFIDICIIAFLLSFSLGAIRISNAVDKYLGRLGDQGDSFAASVATVATTATDLDEKLTPAIAAVPVQLAATNKSIGRVADSFHQAAGTLDQARADFNSQLTNTNKAVRDAANGIVSATDANGNAAGEISSAFRSAAAPIHDLGQQLADVGPLWLDCDHNPDCAFNRYQGTMKALEKASLQAPETAEAWKGISVDVRRVTDRVTAKKKWWQKLEDFGILTALLAARWH
jgi:hypothetical protein